MNKYFLTKFNFITNILIVSALLFGGLVWADSNGIWFFAKDIRGGVFGADENNQDFSFIGEVVFYDDIYISKFIKKNDFSFDIEETSVFNELEINQIQGNSGNVLFVLGDTSGSFSPIEYSWQTSSWSSCSASCGGGVQSRTVNCINSQTNEIVSDNFCSEPKPVFSQNCNTQSCSSGVSYSWQIGSWGSCSASCGGGTQFRSVNCRNDQTGAVVSDSFCSGSKPSTSQSCNTQACFDGSYRYFGTNDGLNINININNGVLSGTAIEKYYVLELTSGVSCGYWQVNYITESVRVIPAPGSHPTCPNTGLTLTRNQAQVEGAILTSASFTLSGSISTSGSFSGIWTHNTGTGSNTFSGQWSNNQLNMNYRNSHNNQYFVVLTR